MPALPCNESPYDAQHFRDMLDRDLGPYLLTWDLDQAIGSELPWAWAEMGARLSLAVIRMECGNIILFAEGGAYATATVTFYRPTPGPIFTLQAGTLVTTGRHDRRFYLEEDVEFAEATVEADATVIAVAYGFEWNVTGPRTAANGETLPGEIDTIVDLDTDPPYADPRMQVRQLTDGVGGRCAHLDGLGDERGIHRGDGEGDDPYRYRIRELPDTVSPGAIRRLTGAILDPKGLSWDFIETWEVGYQTCWDAPSPNPGTPSYRGTVAPLNPDYDHLTFVFDDPRDPDPFRNRWLDEAEARGAFLIIVDQSESVHDLGLAYDDPGTEPGDFRPPGGPTVALPWRGTPAYDGRGGSLAFPNQYPAAYDGFDIERTACFAALFFQLQLVKAAGVAAVMDYIRP